MAFIVLDSQGVQKQNSSSQGYCIPSKEERSLFCTTIQSLGHNTFNVSSISDPSLLYIVVMNTGFCECKVGKDGSPCKHLYLLLENGCIECTIFLPVFQKELRQKYGLIATGKALPMEYYEGLHERVMKNSFNVVIDTNPEIVQLPEQSIESESAPTDEPEVTTLNEECQSIWTEEVLNLLTNTFENLKSASTIATKHLS